MSLLIVTAITFMSVMVFGSTISSSAAVVTGSDEKSMEVVSYIDIFQTYYDTVLEKAKEAGKSEICTFEEFCDKYYYSGMDLQNYTDTVILYSVYERNEDNENILEADSENSALSSSSSSGDANYILSSDDYDSTPTNVFKRAPVCKKYDYSVLQDGDIVYETQTIFFNAGHMALIYNTSKSSGYGSYTQTIDAVLGNVQYGFLDDTRMVDFGIKMLRVSGATVSIRDNAKYFCYKQLGKKYNLWPLRLNTDIDSTLWYCSEMIYAAYKYAGIDIGVKKDSSGNDVYLLLGCLPIDVYNSYNTYSVDIPYVAGVAVDISISTKVGSKWTIKVYNNHFDNITLEYNQKMCFEDDAKNWTNLNHRATKEIAAGGSEDVEISENWFATTVVVSWQYKGRRLITYGYNLSYRIEFGEVYKSMTVKKVEIG